jgi:hypothetical protein
LEEGALVEIAVPCSVDKSLDSCKAVVPVVNIADLLSLECVICDRSHKVTTGKVVYIIVGSHSSSSQLVGEDLLDVLEGEVNGSLNESTFRLVRETSKTQFSLVFEEAFDTFRRREVESFHDIISLAGALKHGLPEPLDVHRVKHSLLIVRDVSLVEQLECLHSVKSGVASLVKSAFRRRDKVHAQCVHTAYRSETGQVSGNILEKVGISPLLSAKIKPILQFIFTREDLRSHQFIFKLLDNAVENTILSENFSKLVLSDFDVDDFEVVD